MALMERSTVASLSDRLAELNNTNRDALPDAALSVIDDATRTLQQCHPSAHAVGVGDTAPAFDLPNATGSSVTLANRRAEGPVVLSFYRGGWCPYCNLELQALQEAVADVEATGAQLVAISPQTPDASLSTQQKHDLSFDVLSDVGNTVADAYGLVFDLPDALVALYKEFGIDLPTANGNDSWTLPMPATFVIDTNGVVRYAFVDEDYTQRADPNDILDVLRSLS